MKSTGSDDEADDPTSPDYLGRKDVVKGNDHFMQRRYTDAVAAFSKALEKIQDDAEILGSRAAALIALGDFDQAEEDAWRLVQTRPDSTKVTRDRRVCAGFTASRRGTCDWASALPGPGVWNSPKTCT